MRYLALLLLTVAYCVFVIGLHTIGLNGPALSLTAIAALAGLLILLGATRRN